MQQKLLLGSRKFDLVIQRLCHQLIEIHDDFSESAIIGLQPRGIYLADRIQQELKKILPDSLIPCGHLDVTFFRDDFRRRDTPLVANSTKIDFMIENKKVILVDDVLYTGRTIRSGLDAMMAFGRPQRVELLVLVDRRYSRHLPIEPDYIGIQVDSIASQSVKVTWEQTEEEDAVYLLNS
ncbi:MAG TPA: bifunctional pyr operon transcriptional regulator/uracil phosphoribosyltransferase PyrR [Anseongella sp.]